MYDESFKYYKQVIDCQSACIQDLEIIVQDVFINDVPKRSYDYLQFAYFKQNNLTKAAEMAASSILLEADPEVNERTTKSLKFYKHQLKQDEKYAKHEIHPTVGAKRFKRVKDTIELLANKFTEAYNNGLDDSGEAEVESPDLDVANRSNLKPVKRIYKLENISGVNPDGTRKDMVSQDEGAVKHKLPGGKKKNREGN